MTDDCKSITRRRQRWIAAVNAGAVNDYLEVLTEDLVWLPPGQPALSGKDEFAAWVGAFFESYEYQFVVKEPEVTLAGDWAVERGTFETAMTSKEDGSVGRHEGTYIVLWRRADDDMWRIERYVDETQIPGSLV